MKTQKALAIMATVALGLLLAVPGASANVCSPTGVWYGGSDYKYLLTITPIAGESFAIRYEAVYDNTAFGYKAWSSWSGKLTGLKNGDYVGQAISMYTTNAEIPPPLNSFELDAVHGRMKFIDCNNIKFTYDFFGAYFGLNKLPFIDPLDLNYLPPDGIVETYRRMPTKCPACNVAAEATLQPQLRRR